MLSVAKLSLRCWNGRCRTCNQKVDLDQLTLFHRRE